MPASDTAFPQAIKISYTEMPHSPEDTSFFKKIREMFFEMAKLNMKADGFVAPIWVFVTPNDSKGFPSKVGIISLAEFYGGGTDEQIQQKKEYLELIGPKLLQDQGAIAYGILAEAWSWKVSAEGVDLESMDLEELKKNSEKIEILSLHYEDVQGNEEHLISEILRDGDDIRFSDIQSLGIASAGGRMSGWLPPANLH